MRMQTIGADPEVLLIGTQTRRFVSAVGKLPGTKEQPHPVKFGAVQVDNVCAEFNIHPAKSAATLDITVEEVMDQLFMMLVRNQCAPSRESVAVFDEDELCELTMRAGCDPDWNAYTLELNEPPDYASTNTRAAGGHVHIGLGNTADIDLPRLVRALDLFITIPMLRYEDPRRRTLYGKAGAFRVKPYGVEYRSPSNHWIFKSVSRLWVYSSAAEACGRHRELEIPADIQDIINNHDLCRAEEMISAFNLARYPN